MSKEQFLADFIVLTTPLKFITKTEFQTVNDKKVKVKVQIPVYKKEVEAYFNSIRADMDWRQKVNKIAMFRKILTSLNDNFNEYSRYLEVNIEQHSFKNMIKELSMHLKVRNNTPSEYTNMHVVLFFILIKYSMFLIPRQEDGNYKVIFNMENVNRTAFISSKKYLRVFMVKLFFNICSKINSMGTDSIEYSIFGAGTNSTEEELDNGLNFIEYDEDDEFEEESEYNNFIVRQFDMSLYKIAQPIKNYKIKGGYMHDKMKLQVQHTQSLINPNNKDKFCILYCMIICKYFYYDKENKTIAQKYNNLENLQEVVDKVKEYIPKCKHLFNENSFICNEKNIKELESIVGINLNIYVFPEEENQKGFSLYHRSSFKNTISEEVVRVVFYPYNKMLIKDRTSKRDIEEINKKFMHEKEIVSVDAKREDYFSRNRGHYTLITKSIAALCTGTDISNDKYVCSFCDIAFSTENMVLKHKNDCKNSLLNSNSEERIITYVNNKKDAKRSFKNFAHLSKNNYIVYADTETQVNNFNENNEIESACAHKLIAYKLFVKCRFDDKHSFSIMKTAETEDQVGDYLLKEFMSDLTNIRAYISKFSNFYPLLDYIEADTFRKNNPISSSCCMFCESKEDLVVHHDHNIKKNNIIGWLCTKCNISEGKTNSAFSIVFHNISYDLLVLIKSLVYSKDIKITCPNPLFQYEERVINVKNEIEIMAKTSCKYSTMTINGEYIKEGGKLFLPGVKFIDSYAFVNTSLSNIVDQMKRSDDKNVQLKDIFPNTFKMIKDKYSGNNDLFELATSKGLIAYSHINIKNLSSKENLSKECYRNDLYMDYSEEYINNQKSESKKDKLRQVKVSQDKELTKDYVEVENSYKLLTKVVGEGDMSYKKYFEFYLDLDVMLLTDFFESLRNKLISSHKIDPAYYIGLPSYSMACCFYLNKKEFHLIEDVEISKTISNNCRGGLSAIFNKSFEAEGDKKFLYGVDVNNLYGHSMSCLLPNKYIGTIENKVQIKREIKNYFKHKNEFGFGSNEIEEYSEHTYFLLTDYKINENLHDKLMKFPPLVTKREVTYKDLSKSQIEEKSKSIKTSIESYKSEKLCGTLENNSDYLMGIDNYAFYKSLGYEIEIKKIFKFEQEYLLKEYIDLNSGLRQKCLNEMEKNLYKLMNNAVYGKQLQNPTKYSELEMLNNEKLIQKRLNSPFFKSAKVVVDDQLVLVDKHKEKLKFDTAIQVGFMILEKSKLHMYSSLYNHFIPFFEEEKIDWKILFHDTDSFYFGIDVSNSRFNNKNEMVAALHKKSPELLDLHKYEDVLVKDTSKKKVVGYFLDEESDVDELIGFVGLCSKSYALLKKVRSNEKDENGEWIYKIKLEVKGKGVSNRYLSNLYSFEDYKKVLSGELVNDSVKFNNIVKKNFSHVVNSIEKKTLTRFCDKFYYYKQNDIIKSLPYGHYKIKDICE